MPPPERSFQMHEKHSGTSDDLRLWPMCHISKFGPSPPRQSGQGGGLAYLCFMRKKKLLFKEVQWLDKSSTVNTKLNFLIPKQFFHV